MVDQFKRLCGAYDPAIGRMRGEQDTLRTLYGLDRHRNAVHCTDLTTEALLEVEFFFVLLPERLDR